QVVGVQVRGEVAGDRVRRQAAQDGGLVEELEAADDGEVRGDDDRPPDRRQLDRTYHLPLACAVDLGGFVQRMRHHAQPGVADDLVVALDLPGDDVADGQQHPCR